MEISSTPSCFGDSTGTISAMISGGTSPYQYLWNNNAKTASLSGVANGIYTVTVTDGNSCDTVAMDSVGEYPEIITGQITGLTNLNPAEVGIYSLNENPTSIFNWIITGGNIVSGQGTNSINIQWSSAGTGRLSVIETNIKGCHGDTVNLEIQIGSTGLNDPIDNGIRIYPNPTTNLVIIEYPNPENKVFQLVLTDMTGKVLKLINNLTEKKIKLDCNHLSTGIYILEIKGSETYRGRIIID